LIGLLAALSSFGGIRPGLWLGNSSVRRLHSSCSNGHRTSFSVLHGRKGQPRVQLKSSKRCPLTWSVRGLCLFERDCPDHQGSSTLLPGGATVERTVAPLGRTPAPSVALSLGSDRSPEDRMEPILLRALLPDVILQGETGLFIRSGNTPNYIANYMNLGLTEYRLLIMPKAGNDRQGLD
jgi:hypothetical protein